MNQAKLEMQTHLNKYSNFLETSWQIKNVSLVGSDFSHQQVQTNVPNVQDKNHKDMKIMIPVGVDIATNLIFLI